MMNPNYSEVTTKELKEFWEALSLSEKAQFKIEMADYINRVSV